MDNAELPRYPGVSLAQAEQGGLRRRNVRKRGALLFKGLLIAAVLVPVTYYLCLLPHPEASNQVSSRVSEENYKKIEPGMTARQVDEILGFSGTEVQWDIPNGEPGVWKRWTDSTAPGRWIAVRLLEVPEDHAFRGKFVVAAKDKGGF
jgi:hypothetical protein